MLSAQPILIMEIQEYDICNPLGFFYNDAYRRQKEQLPTEEKRVNNDLQRIPLHPPLFSRSHCVHEVNAMTGGAQRVAV
jgi:hypothetical protein